MNEKLTDIKIVREAIELFTVHYFDSIEMSGTVKYEVRKNINYISIDLTNTHWDEDLNKLHRTCVKYLKEWARKNFSNFQDSIAISSLIIEYVLPDKEGANQNMSKHVKLFDFPHYYYSNKKNGQIVYKGFILKFLKFWNKIILRNTILIAIPTVLLLLLGIYKIYTDCSFYEKLSQSFDYVNVASGIIASFVLGFLITKVITIRQDKLKYTEAIRELSNKLTYFRNICYNLNRDHVFWTRDKPFYKAHEYANSIRNDITFEDYHYPNFDDDIEYARFRSFYKEEFSNSVVSLTLQLHMMADDSFVNSGLSYTKFPPDYIYSYEEMKDFIIQGKIIL